ncbi:MAG TPA: hypothetical protein VFT34_02785 [Verrucomicrobiae bacterium]|nr:hypothetical protein [Verrucomicrobiae bacterium]
MESLNPIEKEVFDYLRRSPMVYISATEVSKNVGNRKWFNADKNWARPILRRLEMDGWLESNPFGEYRVKARADIETSFRDALGKAGMSLGDTAIITSDDAKGRG